MSAYLLRDFLTLNQFHVGRKKGAQNPLDWWYFKLKQVKKSRKSHAKIFRTSVDEEQMNQAECGLMENALEYGCS